MSHNIVLNYLSISSFPTMRGYLFSQFRKKVKYSGLILALRVFIWFLTAFSILLMGLNVMILKGKLEAKPKLEIMVLNCQFLLSLNMKAFNCFLVFLY